MSRIRVRRGVERRVDDPDQSIRGVGKGLAWNLWLREQKLIYLPSF